MEMVAKGFLIVGASEWGTRREVLIEMEVHIDLDTGRPVGAFPACYVVRHRGQGHYFSTAQQAMEYARRRWPQRFQKDGCWQWLDPARIEDGTAYFCPMDYQGGLFRRYGPGRGVIEHFIRP